MKAPLLLLGLALGLALLLVATGSGSRSSTAGTGAAMATAVPDADAAAGTLVLERCGTCHGLDRLSHNPQDAAGWSRTVDNMQQLGAQVAPQERTAIINYLAAHFGPR